MYIKIHPKMQLQNRRHLPSCLALALACSLVSSCARTGTQAPATKPAATGPSAATAKSKSASLLRVALYRGPGTGGAGPTNLMARLNQNPTMSLTQVTPQQIQDGVLTNYDAVIFAGGTSSGEARGLGDAGKAAVKQFVANGGGYVGICAGAYLASTSDSWDLRLINAKTVSKKWQRGRATVKMEQTAGGNKILGARGGSFDVLYHNGPIVEPAGDADLPPYETLAWFRSEVSLFGSTPGIMSNSPAVFASQFKQGRVLCISPHPEQTAGLDEIVPRAVEWVADPAARNAGQR
jgi:putative intracellular protease/amidase